MNPRFLLAVVLVVVLLTLTRAAWLPWLGEFLVVSDPPIHAADLVLPLAGESLRHSYAAELYLAGAAKQLLITPLPLATQEERDRQMARVRREVERSGVQPDDVLEVPVAGRSTYEEAQNTLAFMLDHDFDTLLVVTSPWHTRRARLNFRTVFRGHDIDISVQPVPDTAYPIQLHTYRPNEWWTYKLGRDPTISEYLKLAAFFIGVR